MAIRGRSTENGFKHLTTYELIPYSISLSSSLLGDHEAAVRLHSLLFGTLMIPLIWLSGRKIITPACGRLASVVYALNPNSIAMANFAFYPQQCQFFALLTILLFYLAVRGVQVDTRYLLASTIGFALTYLCWEGSGFLLIALALSFVLLRPALEAGPHTGVYWLPGHLGECCHPAARLPNPV